MYFPKAMNKNKTLGHLLSDVAHPFRKLREVLADGFPVVKVWNIFAPYVVFKRETAKLHVNKIERAIRKQLPHVQHLNNINMRGLT